MLTSRTLLPLSLVMSSFALAACSGGTGSSPNGAADDDGQHVVEGGNGGNGDTTPPLPDGGLAIIVADDAGDTTDGAVGSDSGGGDDDDAGDTGRDAGRDAGNRDDAGDAGHGYDNSPTIPVPPSSAAVSLNIDDLSGWSAATGAASSCPDGKVSSTCNPPDANYSTTVLHVTDPGTAPAGGNGTAGAFELYKSPAWATAIWGHSLGDTTTARSFIWDFQIYVDATDYATSELDFYQVLDGKRYMMGTQCERSANTWETWNEATQHWVKNPSIPCNSLFTANAWHHVVMYFTTDPTTSEYTYKTIRIDEVDYVLNQSQPAKASTWPNGHFGVQVQLDANSSGAGANEYIDGMKVYNW